MREAQPHELAFFGEALSCASREEQASVNGVCGDDPALLAIHHQAGDFLTGPHCAGSPDDALKVVKPGMDTCQVVARFEAKQQALALMEHPNIAHVFDGGVTVSGRPYFVMEPVCGVPITEIWDQHQVPVRERLELFISVCPAVQHAPQKGITHRDLKPNNVLVTLQDDKAEGEGVLPFHPE